MPPMGTKERRLRRRRSPIGHSNRTQFYFAKRSKFFSLRSCPNYFFSAFLPQLSRAISLSAFAGCVRRALRPCGACFSTFLPSRLSSDSSALPFPEGLFSESQLASGSLGCSQPYKVLSRIHLANCPDTPREPTCAVVSAKRAD